MRKEITLIIILFGKKCAENLHNSKFRRTFAALLRDKAPKDRDLAQLVAHTSGGREVAGSSPVIPTEKG